VLARDLLEDGPEGVAEDSELPRKKMEPSYHEEQEELRKAFLGATNRCVLQSCCKLEVVPDRPSPTETDEPRVGRG
jgi:hypothetical protein